MDTLHKHLYAPFVEHQGTGTLEPEGYPVNPAQFTAGQFPDGDIEIVALSNIPMIIRAGYDGITSPRRATIEGLTSDDFRFTAEGLCNTTFSFSQEGNSSSTVIDAEFMKIINTDRIPPKLIRFGLTSLQFSDILGFAVDQNAIQVTYKGTNIRITPSVYYTNFKKAIQRKKYIDVTAVAEISLIPEQDIDGLLDIMNALCRLLSIAQGTTVNWIFYVVLSNENLLVQSFHRKTIVRAPTNFFVISCKDVQDFLNVSLQDYAHVLNQGMIDSACISSYLDAFSDKINIRTRTISFVVTIERLAHLHRANAVRLSYGENLSNFRKTLNSMCSRYGLSNANISQVLDHRNSLVHEALFKGITDTHSVDKNSIVSYGVLNSFTSKLVLAILNYRGDYLEWFDIPPKLRRVL